MTERLSSGSSEDARRLRAAPAILRAVSEMRPTWRRWLRRLAVWDDWLLQRIALQRLALSSAWRYGMALAVSVAATVLSWELTPWLGTTAPYGLALLGAAATAVMLGLGPALLAALLACGGVEAFIARPLASPLDGPALLRLSFSMLVAVLVVWVLHIIRAAELKSRRSAARLAAFAEATFEGIVESDEGLIEDCNEQFARMAGRAAAELRGTAIADLIAPEDLDRVLMDLSANRESVIEYAMLRHDGTRIVVEARGLPAAQGSPRRYAAIRDITERSQAEKALRQSREDLDRAQEVGRIGWWRLDIRRNVLSWSDENHRIFGVPRGTPLTYQSFQQIVHPDDRQYVDTKWMAGLKGEPYDIEHRIIAEGRVKWVREKAYLEFDDAGGLLGGFGITQDITDRKETEQALFETNQRLLALMNALPVGVSFSEDTSCRCVRGNPALLAQFEITPDDNISASAPDPAAPGRRVRYFLEGRELADRELPLQRAVDEEREIPPMELEVLLPSGRRWYCVASGAPFRDQSGKVIGGVVVTVDVTERKRAEAELRSIASFPEENPSPVLRACAEGLILYANRPARALLDAMYPGEKPTLPNALVEAVGRILAGSEGHEVEIAGPSGSFFSFTLSPSSVEGWVNLYGRDVTKRRRMEDALRESDRRKDEFLATLAHELRNPLAPLRSGLQVLRRVGGAGPDAERMQAMMERQVDHLVRLVDDILEASRISRGKIELRKEPVELAAVIRQAVETSQPLIDAGRHELRLVLPAEPLLIDADPVRLAQVFANLVNNAAKYTDSGGRIRIEAERRGGEVAVSVSDSGRGIPADMLPRVFDLFAQIDRDLGRSQGGLGIGLALVRSLVEMHGGRVEARSDGPGQGSEFVVHLPLIATPAAIVAEPEAPPACAALRILLVDDNRDAADSLGMLLETLGAEVKVVYDGPAGLEALDAFKPRAVLLDLGMPGMDGYETARLLRLSPSGRETTLIALTGWGQDEDQRRTRQAGFDHHLVKPVDIAELQAVLSSLAP